MRDIKENAHERRIVMEFVGDTRKSIVISYNVFEISNGEVKAVINPDNGRQRGFRTKGQALDWIADAGDGSKSYIIQECYQHVEEYAESLGIA